MLLLVLLEPPGLCSEEPLGVWSIPSPESMLSTSTNSDSASDNREKCPSSERPSLVVLTVPSVTAESGVGVRFSSSPSIVVAGDEGLRKFSSLSSLMRYARLLQRLLCLRSQDRLRLRLLAGLSLLDLPWLLGWLLLCDGRVLCEWLPLLDCLLSLMPFRFWLDGLLERL